MKENRIAPGGRSRNADSPPIRVLLVDHADFLGGAEGNALALIKSVDPALYQVSLACPSGALLDAARAMGARTSPLELPRLRGSRNVLSAPFNFVRSTAELVRLIQSECIQIVHSNTMRASIYASVAARRAGVKFVWHVHDLHRSRPYIWLMSWFAHAIIANSRAVAQTIPFVVRRKTTVVYNGVSLSDFDRSSLSGEPFRTECGLKDSELLVGTIGWLAPWKGHRYFIDAARRVAAQNQRVRFVIVGAVTDSRYRAYEQDLRAMGERMLGERLIWAGERTPIQPVLAGLDLLLHCADREPFGRVLVEALAMQVPVIAFDGGGPDEIIAQGATGFLIPAGNVEAMSAATVSILADAGARHAMGQAGRERVRTLFDSDTIARQVEQVYRSLGDSP